ncbi:MAG: glutathione S-transferase family protein [Silicimonas sp.]|nr:glutathione S-transferase family protein [Silicimonas sp.]
MLERKLTLISHHLCPYVQRAAIALNEKSVGSQRRYVDLSNKPAWFTEISPLGKTPVLLAGATAIFESAAILEYLEDTLPHPLHPADPLERARHRGWIEFGSVVLNDIARLYNAADRTAFDQGNQLLRSRFELLERQLGPGKWFAGTHFSLVDAVFGPVFRYFDTFERIADLGVLDGLPNVAEWRAELAARPSVRQAVTGDYDVRLRTFLAARGSVLSELMTEGA